MSTPQSNPPAKESNVNDDKLTECSKKECFCCCCNTEHEGCCYLTDCLFYFCIILVSLFPIFLIVAGWIYQNSCSIQPMIPIWLILTGVFGLLPVLLHLFTSLCLTNNDCNYRTDFEGVLMLFSFMLVTLALYICGIN